MRYTKKQIKNMTNAELIYTITCYCCSGYGEILGTKHKEQVFRWILSEMTNRGFTLTADEINDLASGGTK